MQSEMENRILLDLRRTRSMGALPSETSLPSRPDWFTSQLAQPLTSPPNPIPQPNQDEHGVTVTDSVVPPGLLGKILVLLGHAGPNAKARRALVSLIISLLWWFTQFGVIIALLAYSAVHRSPTIPQLTEWVACDRALGPWNAVWIVRTILGAALAFWAWRRGRAADRIRIDNNDAEQATLSALNEQPQTYWTTSTSSRQQSRRTAGPSSDGTSRSNDASLPPSRFYPGVSLLTSLLTLAWFLSAHVLEYTSLHTCRITSPHIWWLTFGILCTLYLEILEVLGLGLLVIVIGPVLFLVYNIIFLCLGRHPLQNPHYIKPDIDKIPKNLVDQIPLVLYIPPPPGESTDTSPITIPPPTHAYPPKSPTSPTSSPATVPKRRFMWFRRKSKSTKTKNNTANDKGRHDLEKNAAGGDVEEDDDSDVPWDEMWEKGEYPFVRLEGNRAVCAICLMDFEEPKRIGGVKVKPSSSAPPPPTSTGPGGSGEGKEGSAANAGSGDVTQVTQQIRVEAVTEEERDALHLNDAGEGAQPLRLLSCGHAFHQTCVDPWLTNVSGRCPVCQRPVEILGPKKNRRHRRT